MQQVEALLDYLHLGEYKHMFCAKSMVGHHLQHVRCQEDLKELGINLPCVKWKALESSLEVFRQCGVPSSIFGKERLDSVPLTCSLATLDVRQVGDLLDHLDLEEYKDAFAAQSMSGINLQHIQARKDLEQLGIHLPNVKWRTFETHLLDFQQHGVPLAFFESSKSTSDQVSGGAMATTPSKVVDTEQRSLYGTLCIMFAAPLVDEK